MMESFGIGIETHSDGVRRLEIYASDLIGLFETSRRYIAGFGKPITTSDGAALLGLHSNSDITRLISIQPLFQCCIHPALNNHGIQGIDMAGAMLSRNINLLSPGKELFKGERTAVLRLSIYGLEIDSEFTHAGYGHRVNAVFKFDDREFQMEELFSEWVTALSLCHEYFCASYGAAVGSISFVFGPMLADSTTVEYEWPQAGREAMDEYRNAILNDSLHCGKMGNYDITKLGSQLGILSAMDSVPLGITDKWLRTGLIPIRNILSSLQSGLRPTDSSPDMRSLMKIADKIGRLDWRIAAQTAIEYRLG